MSLPYFPYVDKVETRNDEKEYNRHFERSEKSPEFKAI